jgi:putative phage-type endonuclease
MTDLHLSPERVGRITGSQAGAILGLSPWQKPADVLRAMVRKWHGAPNEFNGNFATNYGQLHEPLAKMQMMAYLGDPIEDCGFCVHPDHDWLGATPDGLLAPDYVVEIKCPFGLRRDNPPKFKTAKEQPHYYAQMQIEMAVTGRSVCMFYQWARYGDHLEIVQLDKKWILENIPRLKEFHELFLKEIDNHAHLEPIRKEIATDDHAALLEEWDACTAAIAEGEQRKKEILAALVESAGEKDAEICGRKLTKVERKGSVDYTKIPALRGLDLEPFRKPSSSYWRLS